MGTQKQQSKRLTLAPAQIDEASELTAAMLKSAGASSKDITRCRLSVEEILSLWAQALGEATPCTFECGVRLGGRYIRLSAPGKRADPHVMKDDLFAGSASGGQSLLASIGLNTVYSYENGVNQITLNPPRHKPGGLLKVGIALALAVAAGIGCMGLDAPVRSMLSQDVFSPLFDTLMNLLSAIAGPMVFLAVCSGIYNIGDLALFGRIGKKLVGRFLLMTFGLCILTLVMVIGFFPVSVEGGATGNGASQIYHMVLDIVPANIVEPFQTGNVMQIIFLGCACGIGILILGSRVSALADIVGQIHNVVQLLMSTIGRLVPLFVFACIFNIFLSDLGGLSGMGKQILMTVFVLAVFVLGYALTIVFRFKVPLPLLLKKFMPTFLVALSTASSAAAYSTNIETCQRKLGIQRKLVDFGVPMGQVIFMPGGGVAFLIASLCISQMYGVTITPVWLVIAVLVSGILAVAAPPIPGGSMSCYTILFAQLGIPAEGVALAISVDILMDFVITAMDLLCLQAELIFAAHSLDMLDENVLRK